MQPKSKKKSDGIISLITLKEYSKNKVKPLSCQLIFPVNFAYMDNLARTGSSISDFRTEQVAGIFKKKYSFYSTIY